MSAIYGAHVLDSAINIAPLAGKVYAGDWAHTPDFPADFANLVVGRGATPMLTQEPWDSSAGVNQPAYRLSAIAGGTYDALVKRWASEIKAWGRPMLRFAHEINGNWYPWDEGVNGNTAGQHVVSLFRAAGATNVTWVWVGWQSFEQVFGPSIMQIKALSGKPLMLSEVGSAEQGGNKASWISEFSRLSKRPEICGFIWFNHNKEADWRIQSPDASRISYAAAVAAARYV